MDITAWLKLFDAVGFPVALWVTCTFGASILFTRLLWPFFIKEVWPNYLARSTGARAEVLAQRASLVSSIDNQRAEAIGAIDRLRESYSVQLESRSQELMRLIKEVSSIAVVLKSLSESVIANTKATEAILIKIREMTRWSGVERRVAAKDVE